MRENSKKSAIGPLVAAVGGLVVAKGFWVAISTLYLPHSGIDLKEDSGLKPLYYHYNLASKKEVIKPIVHTKPPRAVVRKEAALKKPEKINSFILRGLYSSIEKKIAVVEYLGKTAVLKTGEELEGYKLTNVFDTYATFVKDAKEYTLKLYTPKKAKKELTGAKSTQVATKPNSELKSRKQKPNVKQKPVIEAPRQEGDTTVIPKNLFNRYKNNIKQIRRNINMAPNMANGKLQGFKVNFIRAGSDFSKLGLKRGDIMTAINGEPLTSFKAAIEFYNRIDTITSATVTIKRGNETKELEYEVR